ncbi:trans-sulfuration enzyme family protein [Ruegeria atlantica]|uniref:trans-sulfuration enzyme family protein n=1 Tax=Ruegeria atlantica TaxID=81569 RepID=UPI00147FB0B2|nr:PLP-dependent aspartate aminotransferase family protein [Ruegeria atlantica]
MMLKANMLAIETRAIHAGQEPDPLTGAVVQPIYTASTFVQDGVGENKGYMYSRTKNPTRSTLEVCLANLESASDALAFPTGLSAAATILELLDANSEIVAHHDLYGGIYRLFSMVRNRSSGHNIKFVNFSDIDAVRDAISDKTKLVWFETPSNPLLEIVEIEGVVRAAKEVGAMTVCDNTFSSPYCQRPLEMGVDFVLHSATKFLNGHSDLLAGVVAISPSVPAEIGEQLRFIQNSVGAVLDPISCSTLLRSLKTLTVRMDRHIENASTIAAHVDANRGRYGIQKLLFPGLESHPGHEIAKKQMKGFGSMVSFVLDGGQDRANRVAQNLEIFAYAVSLGGVESLVQHPASMTHKILPPERREALGVSDSLLRISVGIEHVDDLIADLDQALMM